MKPIKNYEEFVNEAWIGPFVFNEDMTDDELKAIYQGALDGFAYWQKGFEYPKADYKKAYTEIGKILKKRGVNVDESVNEKLDPNKLHDILTSFIDIAGKLTKVDLSHIAGQQPRDLDDCIRLILNELPKEVKNKFVNQAEKYIETKKIKESVNEGSNHEMVKKEAISRLSDFFRVSPGPLMKFKFDGNDNIKELTKVLNSTSDQGTELYYKTAIKLAQEEVGFDESIDESNTTINIPNLSDIDHTRIIKWMSNQFDGHSWNMKKLGAGFEIDIKKLSKREQEDLMNYLKSQDYINETLNLDEGAVKQFEIDYKDMETNIKRGIGWIEPDYVEETWENSSDTIDYEIVRNEILTRLIKAGLLYTSRDGETQDKKITNISQIK